MGSLRTGVLKHWDAVAQLTPVIKAAKAHGSLCIGQLTHGGRQVRNLRLEQDDAAEIDSFLFNKTDV